jgi:hypothetical protein
MTHGRKIYRDASAAGHLKEEVELDEKELTDTDVKQKEKVVKGMKKNLQSFKDKYGERAKGVMHATATNIAKKMPDVKEEVEELEEGNFEKNMDIIKSGKLPPHIQAILDKRGAKGNDAIMAKGRVEKLKSMKEMLDEARAKKEPMEVYHTGYSAALQHAEKHLNKQGYEIHPDDWPEHISHGPSKPSDGKTVKLHVPLHKDGVKSKKVAHIQVYNRGNTIPKNNELNMYVN